MLFIEFFFFFSATSDQSMWDRSRPGIKPVPLALRAWSLNHQITVEVMIDFFFFFGRFHVSVPYLGYFSHYYYSYLLCIHGNILLNARLWKFYSVGTRNFCALINILALCFGIHLGLVKNSLTFRGQAFKALSNQTREAFSLGLVFPVIKAKLFWVLYLVVR